MALHLHQADPAFGDHQDIDIRGMQIESEEKKFLAGLERAPGFSGNANCRVRFMGEIRRPRTSLRIFPYE